MRWTEMVVCRKPCTLQEIVITSLTKRICKLIDELLKPEKSLTARLFMFSSKSSKRLTSFSDVHKYLYGNLPSSLCSLLSSELLVAFRKVVMEKLRENPQLFSSDEKYYNLTVPDVITDKTLHRSHMWNLLGEMLDALLHPTLRCLDVSSWPSALAPDLARSLFKLTKLQSLCLRGVQRPQAWRLHESLVLMTHLSILDLRECASDALVSLLAEHCPHLTVLWLSWAEAVTDRCLPALLQLRYLRRLDVTETGISHAGVTTLLSRMTHLHELTVGVDVPLETILLHIPEHQLSLHQIKIAEPHELHKVVQKLPELRCIDLVGPRGDISCLSELTHLKELSLDLSTLNDDEDNVIGLLSVVGAHSLRKLSLSGTSSINLPALAAMCPQLKKLHLVNCSFLPQERAPAAEFRKLEELSISSPRQAQVWLLLEQMLCGTAVSTLRCLKIDTSMSPSASSHKLANLLLAHPLPCLEELMLRGRILFTASTLRQIVRMNAISLRRIGRAEFWERVIGEDLRLLCEELHTYNHLLTIF